jgi:ubiquinone/menaquinone biosynthesis C-methylase UbiE
MSLWDYCGRAGYENIYLVRIVKAHLDSLGGTFLASNGGKYLDAGCGTGKMLELIVQKIQPVQLYAVDWSEEMLEKAKLEAEKVGRSSQTDFKFYCMDLSKALDWPDGFFDGVVSNMLICYLTCGWRKSLEELVRVIKPGGYLYLGTLTREWGFTKVLWKHFLIEFLREPMISIRQLKYRPILAKISKEAEKHGAEFPSRQALEDFVKARFEEVQIIPTYWRGGVALRARLPR